METKQGLELAADNEFFPMWLRNACKEAIHELDALRKDAERYRWLRDKGSDTWRPFVNQWHMDAALCDAAIDNEMAKQRQFCAA